MVSQARAREAELVANMQSGVFGPVVEQQLKQARLDAEGARQVSENWKVFIFRAHRKQLC